MSQIHEWSTTAASNNSAPPDGWPEGQAPSTVNDCAREMMAALKTWYLQSFIGHIGGLTLSNNGTDGDHDIDIAKGAAMDTTGVEIMEQTTAGLTKRLDASWAVGDGNGGLDTGAIAADTLYAVWLIADQTNNVVDALFSTAFSWSGVTKPTNYTIGQLIGAVVTDASSNIIAFTQSGDYFRLTGDVIVYNDSSITDDTFETTTLKVPPLCLAHIYASASNTTGTGNVIRCHVKTNGAADVADNAEVWSIQQVSSGEPQFTGGVGMVLTDASSRVQYAAEEADGAVTFNLHTFGWQMLTRGNAS